MTHHNQTKELTTWFLISLLLKHLVQCLLLRNLIELRLKLLLGLRLGRLLLRGITLGNLHRMPTKRLRWRRATVSSLERSGYDILMATIGCSLGQNEEGHSGDTYTRLNRGWRCHTQF
jgi:hypothetical protein